MTLTSRRPVFVTSPSCAREALSVCDFFLFFFFYYYFITIMHESVIVIIRTDAKSDRLSADATSGVMNNTEDAPSSSKSRVCVRVGRRTRAHMTFVCIRSQTVSLKACSLRALRPGRRPSPARRASEDPNTKAPGRPPPPPRVT